MINSEYSRVFILSILYQAIEIIWSIKKTIIEMWIYSDVLSKQVMIINGNRVCANRIEALVQAPIHTTHFYNPEVRI